MTRRRIKTWRMINGDVLSGYALGEDSLPAKTIGEEWVTKNYLRVEQVQLTRHLDNDPLIYKATDEIALVVLDYVVLVVDHGLVDEYVEPDNRIEGVPV